MSDVREAPFSRRALAWVIGLAVVSFVVAIGVSIFGADPDTSPSAGADSYSRSALGHRGLVELLEASGVRVVRSQHASGARAGTQALLLVAEPRLGSDEQKQALATLVHDARHVVLVLPKRSGFQDPTHRGWIDEAELRPIDDAEAVLAAAGLEAKVVRPSEAPRLSAQGSEAFATGAEVQNLQLVELPDGTTAQPLLSADAGALIVRFQHDGTDLIVIADPDLVANHGLGKGDNAAIALAAIERARPPGAVVVVDETLHGHVATPGLARELFRFPVSVATTSALLALALLLWSAMGRFGKPRTETRALGAGKRSLIDNTAELTRHGGHAAHALERYLQATVHDVARASHAPASLGPGELRAWLGRAGKARQVGTDLAVLEREVAEIAATSGPHHRQATRALAAAARIHRWRQEMTDGSAGHSRAS